MNPNDPRATLGDYGIYAIRVEPNGRTRSEGYWVMTLSHADVAWAEAIRLQSQALRTTVTVVVMETQKTLDDG